MEGDYTANFPNLPGFVSGGDTYDEVKTKIKEAMEIYLTTMKN